eukprot:4359848-Prymnesium_polylepis.1
MRREPAHLNCYLGEEYAGSSRSPPPCPPSALDIPDIWLPCTFHLKKPSTSEGREGPDTGRRRLPPPPRGRKG